MKKLLLILFDVYEFGLWVFVIYQAVLIGFWLYRMVIYPSR